MAENKENGAVGAERESADDAEHVLRDSKRTNSNDDCKTPFPIKKLSFSCALEEGPLVEQELGVGDNAEEQKMDVSSETESDKTDSKPDESAVASKHVDNVEDDQKSASLQVVLRIRPLSVQEAEIQNCGPCILKDDDVSVRIEAPEKSRAFRKGDQIEKFSFTHVYCDKTSQREIFESRVRPRVDGLFEAKSALVMSYGITNAGKTFTILGNQSEPGIIPRSLERIFDRMSQSCDKNVTQEHTWRVEVSFYEIYNQQVHDLLAEPKETRSTIERPNLRIRNNKGYIYVDKAVSMEVKSTEDALKALYSGTKRRHVAHTKLNAGSSRSHSIFTIKLFNDSAVKKGRKKKKATRNSIVPYAELSVVDLAGSERMRRTKNRGQRVREASSINKSLSTMMRCIRAMLEKQQSHKECKRGLETKIPFRESKLTQLLQQHLQPRVKKSSSGVCRGRKNTVLQSNGAIMIVNVSSTAADLDETIHVLRHSAVARQIELKPRAAVSAEISGTQYDMNGRRVTTAAMLASDEEEDEDLVDAIAEDVKTVDVVMSADAEPRDHDASSEIHAESHDDAKRDMTPRSSHSPCEEDSRRDTLFQDLKNENERLQHNARTLEQENFQLRQALRENAATRGAMESAIREEVSLEMAEAIEDERVRFQKELDMQKKLFAEKSEKMKSLWKKRTRNSSLISKSMLVECEQEMMRMRGEGGGDSLPSDASTPPSFEHRKSASPDHDRYDVLNAAFEALQQRFTALQHHEKELGHALRISQSKLDSKTSELEEMRLQCDALREHIRDLKAQTAELSGSVDERQLLVTTRDKELGMAQSRIRALEKQLQITRQRLADIVEIQQIEGTSAKKSSKGSRGSKTSSERRSRCTRRSTKEEDVLVKSRKRKSSTTTDCEEESSEVDKADVNDENEGPLTESEVKSRNFVAAMKRPKQEKKKRRRKSKRSTKKVAATPVRAMPRLRSHGPPKAVNAAHTCWHVGTHRPFAANRD